MAWVLLALGAVLVAEGLLWSLAPRLIEDLLEALRRLSLPDRRLVGLGALAAGVAFVWAGMRLLEGSGSGGGL